MRLKGKNIIVTAAAQGIGRATALNFAQEGANVIATDINYNKIKELDNLHQNLEIKELDSTNNEKVKAFAASVNEIVRFV